MARRSGRLSSTPKASNGRSVMATTSTKRSEASDLDSTPRAAKMQKRASNVKTTPKKSKHFTKSDIDDATGLTSEETSDALDGGEESDFNEDGALGSTADDDDEEVDDDDEEDFTDDEQPKRKKQKKSMPKASRGQSRSSLPSRTKGEELWREGVTAGMEPGTEIIIKKPKARPAGKTPYKDETIHPNTLLFLGELKQNNDREWLKMHDPDFRASEKDFKSFVEALTQRLIEIDDTVPELPVKDIVFRIYRDVRFSPDPTPYKPYFSAAWSRTGRKGPYAAYYLQIAPGESFLGGGSWFPESQPLSRLRADIDQQPERFKNVLMDDRMRKEFLSGAAKKADKVVKAFTSAKLNADSSLKTRPQGYAKDHRDIDLLRLKNYTIGRDLDDSEIVSPKFVERVAYLMSVMQPYIQYLNSVVMPDDPPEDSDGSGDTEESDE